MWCLSGVMEGEKQSSSRPLGLLFTAPSLEAKECLIFSWTLNSLMLCSTSSCEQTYAFVYYIMQIHFILTVSWGTSTASTSSPPTMPYVPFLSVLVVLLIIKIIQANRHTSFPITIYAFIITRFYTKSNCVCFCYQADL